MQILPNGLVRITNSSTQQTKDVNPSELDSYSPGLSVQYKTLSGQTSPSTTTPPITTSPTTSTPATLPKISTSIPETVGNFLAPRTTAIVKDVVASSKTGEYVKSMESRAKQLTDLAQQIRTETDPTKKKLLVEQSRSLSNSETPSAPVFSQDINKSYLERGLKTGAELGSYAVPAGKGVKAAAIAGGGAGLLRSLSNDKITAGNVAVNVAGGAVVSAGMEVLMKYGGKLLQNEADNLGLKGLRPSKTQISKFEDVTGQDLGTFVKDNQLYNKGTQQVDDLIGPLQQKYDDLAMNSGTKVPKEDIISMFQNKIDELKAIPNTNTQAVASQLEKEVSLIDSAIPGKEVGLDWVTSNRRAIDDILPKGTFTLDDVAAGKNKIVRDVYKKIIDNSTSGETGSIGKSLNALYTFRDIADIQQNLGKGNLPIGLTTILSTLGGGALGAGGGYASGKNVSSTIKGALLGAGLTSVANNPKVISFLIQTLEKGGEALAKGSGGLSQILARQGGINVANEISQPGQNEVPNSQPQNNLPHIDTSVTPPTGNVQSALPPVTTPQPTTSTVTGHTVEEHLKALAQATAAGDKQAVSQISSQLSIEQAYQKDQASKVPKAGAIAQIRAKTEAKNGLSNLNIIKQQLGMVDAQGKDTGTMDRTELLKDLVDPRVHPLETAIDQALLAYQAARASRGATGSDNSLAFLRKEYGINALMPQATIIQRLNNLQQYLLDINGEPTGTDTTSTDALPAIGQ